MPVSFYNDESMMKQKQCELIPVVSSMAGACLHFANWQSSAVNTLSYHVDDLLMKPGFDFLNQLVNFRAYSKWPGKIVFNASTLEGDEAVCIRSIYDGSVIKVDKLAVLRLLIKLAPDILILPSNCLPYFHQGLVEYTSHPALYFPWQERNDEDNNHYYLTRDAIPLFKDYLAVAMDTTKSLYLVGPFDWQESQALMPCAQHMLESNQAAADALNGFVYRHDKLLAIKDVEQAMIHEVIDKNCACLTCKTPFTLAYLHHLFKETPLLATRYLICHNTYYWQHYLI